MSPPPSPTPTPRILIRSRGGASNARRIVGAPPQTGLLERVGRDGRFSDIARAVREAELAVTVLAQQEPRVGSELEDVDMQGSEKEDIDDDGPKTDEEEDEPQPRDKGKGRGSPGAASSPPSTPLLLPRASALTPASSFEDVADFFLDGRPDLRPEDGAAEDVEGDGGARSGAEPSTPIAADDDDGMTGRGKKRMRVCPPTPPRAAVAVTARRRGPTTMTPMSLLSRTRPATQARTHAPPALPGPAPRSLQPRRMVPGFEYAHSLAAFNAEVRRRAQVAPPPAHEDGVFSAEQKAALRDQHPLPVYTSSDEELWAAVPDLPLQELGEMCDRAEAQAVAGPSARPENVLPRDGGAATLAGPLRDLDLNRAGPSNLGRARDARQPEQTMDESMETEGGDDTVRMRTPAQNDSRAPVHRRPATPHPMSRAWNANAPAVNLRDSLPQHLRDANPLDWAARLAHVNGQIASRLREQTQRVHPDLLALGSTRTEPLTTPRPPNGFPLTHHDAPRAIYRGLTQGRLDTINGEPAGTTLVAQIYNVGYPRPGQVRALSTALSGSVGVITREQFHIVVPPQANTLLLHGRRDAPITWAIIRLSPEAAALLLEGRVWSTPQITFFVYSRDPVIPRYLITLAGFAHEHDILPTIWNTFRGDAVYPQIVDMILSEPEAGGIDLDEAVNELLGSIEIRIDNLPEGNIHARIYMDSPTSDEARWVEWRDYMMNVPFESNINMTTVAARFPACAGCHSADHTTLCCPFQDLPGWNAPRAGGAFAFDTASSSTQATSGQMPLPALTTNQMSFGNVARGRGFGGRRGGPSRGRRGGMGWSGNDENRPY